MTAYPVFHHGHQVGTLEVEEVSDELEVRGRERVRQIENHALAVVRGRMGKEGQDA